MSDNDHLPDDYFKCVKVSLQHVIKNYNINYLKINEVVIKAHKLVIHTLQFMKLYLLHYYNKNDYLPKINKKFINSCMKILCVRTDQRGKKPTKKTVNLNNA